MLFTRNAAGTSATLTIPSTGFSRTFSAANEDELEDEIRDFFEQEGADAYADFLAEINKQTSLGVNDGNPLATTALLADIGFYRFGFTTRRPGDESIPLPVGFDLRLTGGVSEAEAGDDDDEELSGSLRVARFRAEPALRRPRRARRGPTRFATATSKAPTSTSTARTIALPIALIPGNEGGLSWHVTPAFVGGFGGSWDLAAGGLPRRRADHQLPLDPRRRLDRHDGQPDRLLRRRADRHLRLPLRDRDQPGDRQERPAGRPRPRRPRVRRRRRRYTNLLDDAFVEDYFSADVGVGFRLGGSVLRIGYHGDFAMSSRPTARTRRWSSPTDSRRPTRHPSAAPISRLPLMARPKKSRVAGT